MENLISLESCQIPCAVRGMHVLLVDYDISSLMHMASMLEQQSYKVRTAQLASVALSMIEKGGEQLDLVMADVNMPEMDMFSFLKQLFLLRDMPIILMSVGGNLGMAKKALNEGACLFLQKPICKQDLRKLWQHVYRKKIWKREENERISLLKGDAKQNLHGICMEDSLWSSRKDNLGESVGSQEFEERVLEKKGKKRKEKENGNGEKKSRMTWTPELHLKFMKAISILSEKAKDVHPKTVMEIMKVPNLTIRHVASHLQKYKKMVERISHIHEANPLLVPSKSNFYSGIGFPQTQEKLNPLKSPQSPMTLNYGNEIGNTHFNPIFPQNFGHSTSLYADLFANLQEKLQTIQPTNALFHVDGSNNTLQNLGHFPTEIPGENQVAVFGLGQISSPNKNKLANGLFGTSERAPNGLWY